MTFRLLLTALYGCWRLTHWDRKGFGYFQGTPRAFWQSFWAAALGFPAYGAMLLLDLHNIKTDPIRLVLIEMINYAITWVAFPLVMIWIVDRLGRWPLYYTYMTIYNWFRVIQMMILAPLNLVIATGLVPMEAGLLLNAAGVTAILLYDWFIAKESLALDGKSAAAIVVADMLVSGVVNLAAETLINLPIIP